MTKYFNTEGSCKPKEHYMVKLDDRLGMMKNLLVDRKKYFVINRGRQYGKTTTLRALEEYLKDDYIVLSLDFNSLERKILPMKQHFHMHLQTSFSEHFKSVERMTVRKC